MFGAWTTAAARALMNNDTTSSTSDDHQDQPVDDVFTTTGSYDDANNVGSAIVRETFRVYGSMYLVCFALFCLLRRYCTRLFSIRSWVPELEGKIAKAANYPGFVSWWLKVFWVNDVSILEDCGLDALCFLRAIRFGIRLSILGCFNAIWLLPLYATATNDSSSDGIARLSTSNVPNSSPRFIGTIVAAYITFLGAMYLLHREMVWFSKQRHSFLSQKSPRNYSVIVTGIPGQYRSSCGLVKYFRWCSSRDAVLEAHVTMNIPDLEEKVRRRDALVQKLEHAVALEKRDGGKTRTHRQFGLRHGGSIMMKKVETVATCEEQLRTLEREIKFGVGVVMNSQMDLKVDDSTDNRSVDTESYAHLQSTSGIITYGDSMDDELKRILDEKSPHATNNNIKHSIQQNGSSFEESYPLVEMQDLGSRNSVEDEIYDQQEEKKAELSSDEECSPGLGVDALQLGSAFSLIKEKEDDDSDAQEEFGTDGGSVGARESSTTPFPDMLEDECDGYGVRTMPTEESDSEDNAQEQNIVSDISFSKSPESLSDSRTNLRSSSVSSGAGSVSSPIVTESLVAAPKSITKGSRAVGSVIKKVATGTLRMDKLLLSAGEKSLESMKTAQAVGTQLVSSAGTVVPILVPRAAGTPRDAGFVVFSSLHAAQMALQMLQHPKPSSMSVQEAPNPEDISWTHVGMPVRARRVGLALSFSASSVLCIFWSFPTAAIASLTEVNSLKNSIPGLEAFIDKHPAVERLLALIAPTLLLFLNEIVLPSILKFFASWEGHISKATLEASLFLKLGCFMIIQTFFVSAISGSIFSSITNILENPSEVVDLLANSLPSQSSYFMQILLASTFLLQSMECLRAYPLTSALVRKCFGPRLTKKERRRSWWSIHSLEDPPLFWHAETFAQMILYFMVFFVYATISPVTSFLLLFCFLLMESGYRYQFFHNYPPHASESGGRLWRYFFEFTMASMIIAQLTLVGLLLLKQSFYAIPAMAPLIALTILFIICTSREFRQVIRFLPTRDCALIDSQPCREGEALDFLQGQYLQPALKNEEVEPDYEEIDQMTPSTDNEIV